MKMNFMIYNKLFLEQMIFTIYPNSTS